MENTASDFNLWQPVKAENGEPVVIRALSHEAGMQSISNEDHMVQNANTNEVSNETPTASNGIVVPVVDYCKTPQIEHSSLGAGSSTIVPLFPHLQNARHSFYTLVQSEVNKHQNKDLFNSESQRPDVSWHTTCDICDKSFDGPNHFQDFMKHYETIHRDGERFKCDFCAKTFRRRRETMQHRSIHVKHKNRSNCDPAESHRPEVERHTGERLFERESIQPKAVRGASASNSVSQFAHLTAAEVALKLQQQQQAASRNTNCSMCDKSFDGPNHFQDFMKHYETIHRDGDRFKCDFCAKTFKRRIETMRHRSTHVKPYDSDTVWRQLFLHTTTEIKRHSCDQCEMQFISIQKLETHKKQKHTKVKCELCDETFDFRRGLRIHVNKVHKSPKKRIKCDYCEMTFRNVFRVRNHTMVHTGEKPFKCDDCGKRFRLAAKLTLHKRTHTGEKPLKCTEPNCNARFSQPRSLLAHQRRDHGAPKPACHVCGKKCSDEYNLKKHVDAMHEGIIKFECKFCGKKFRNVSNGMLHERKH